jgi:hypothetical protein
MAEVGRNVPNTIAKAPITFAMVELAEAADCNSRKSQWLAYGFKDVTPKFGTQSSVPSLNGAMVAPGREMLKAMATVGADWLMLSGHHGALYASDYNLFPAADGSMDQKRIVNEEQYCGFFNEAYHESYWEHASRDHHDSADFKPKAAALLPSAIYLRTTDTAPADIASHDQDNPMFDATSSSPPPKGIIISACNTLIYKSARTTWSNYFPNAVIFGTISRIVTGTWVTNAIAAVNMTNEAFWRDPQSILDQPGMCEQLADQLKQSAGRSFTMGFLYKGKLYKSGSSQSATDPL